MKNNNSWYLLSICILLFLISIISLSNLTDNKNIDTDLIMKHIHKYGQGMYLKGQIDALNGDIKFEKIPSPYIYDSIYKWNYDLYKPFIKIPKDTDSIYVWKIKKLMGNKILFDSIK